MKRILAVDSSAKTAGVAMLDGEVVAELNQNSGLTHSQTLMPMAERALEMAGLAPGDLDGLAVVVGPGSFTGVRIGVAAVKAMAQALNKPVCPVNALDMLAMNLPACPDRVCAIMDARRRQVYAGVFRMEAGRPRVQGEYRALALAELLAELGREPGPVWFVGDGVGPYRDLIAETLAGARFPHAGCLTARAALAAALAEQGPWLSPAEVEPIYLRLPQAEREWRARHG